MLEKLQELERKYRKLTEQMADPSIATDHHKMAELAKACAELAEPVRLFQEYRRLTKELAQAQELIAESDGDAELKELAEQEVEELKAKLESLEGQLKEALIPRDERDSRNVIMEIRAGTGGDEASLFAAELLRAYQKYVERKKLKLEILSSHLTSVGGLKEIVFLVSGKGAYSLLKHESGTHRVQRVPVTESSGRIHTSAVTVAVLPEAEEVEVEVNPEDLRIDVFRATGPGGQSVNTTDSAVRITHLSTGLVVSCQDEKSQHKNKTKAMKILRARLLDMYQAQADAERADERRAQVKSGDRSERIRTYNFPQNRVTDHRANLTLYSLERVMEGEFDQIIEALMTKEKEEKLSAAI